MGGPAAACASVGAGSTDRKLANASQPRGLAPLLPERDTAPLTRRPQRKPGIAVSTANSPASEYGRPPPSPTTSSPQCRLHSVGCRLVALRAPRSAPLFCRIYSTAPRGRCSENSTPAGATSRCSRLAVELRECQSASGPPPLRRSIGAGAPAPMVCSCLPIGQDSSRPLATAATPEPRLGTGLRRGTRADARPRVGFHPDAGRPAPTAGRMERRWGGVATPRARSFDSLPELKILLFQCSRRHPIYSRRPVNPMLGAGGRAQPGHLQGSR